MLYYSDNHSSRHIEIVLLHQNTTIVENYSFSNGQYLQGEIQIIPGGAAYYFRKTGDKKIYVSYSDCDTLINRIRHEASYLKQKSGIEEKARKFIGWGYGACDYNFTREEILNKCSWEYTQLVDYRYMMAITFIDSVEVVKKEEYLRIREDPVLANQHYVDSFLTKFGAAPTDCRLLTIIIGSRPDIFLTAVQNMDLARFYWFTLMLEHFPDDVNIRELKSRLKKVPGNSRQKRAVLRHLNNKPIA